MVNEDTPGARVEQRLKQHWPPISRSRLARRLDMDPAAVARIFSGKRRTPEGFYERIADILGCDVSEFVTSSDGVAA